MFIGWLCLQTSFAETQSLTSDIELAIQQTIEYRQHRIALNLPSIPADAYTQLSNNNVVTGLQDSPNSDIRIGWGVAIFPIPIKQMYAAINDEEHHVEFSQVDATIVIKGTPCSDGRLVFMNLPVPMFDDRWWVTTHRTNTNLRVKSSGQMAELSWSAIPDPPLNGLPEYLLKSTKESVNISKSTGAWLLIKIDDNFTLGEYHSWSDPGGYIPAGVASTLGAQGIEKNFKSMQDYAQEAPIKCFDSW